MSPIGAPVNTIFNLGTVVINLKLKRNIKCALKMYHTFMLHFSTIDYSVSVREGLQIHMNCFKPPNMMGKLQVTVDRPS
jgi:hypothetical protein